MNPTPPSQAAPDKCWCGKVLLLAVLIVVSGCSQKTAFEYDEPFWLIGECTNLKELRSDCICQGKAPRAYVLCPKQQ